MQTTVIVLIKDGTVTYRQRSYFQGMPIGAPRRPREKSPYLSLPPKRVEPRMLVKALKKNAFRKLMSQSVLDCAICGACAALRVEVTYGIKVNSTDYCEDCFSDFVL
jgi:hypothetical protein